MSGAVHAVADRDTPVQAATKTPGPGAWLRRHRTSLLIVAPLLVIIGLATAWNMQGYPGRVNDDEGTYVAEAWAMLVRHHLSNYTYWYDHPPLGWAQIAGYAWLTGGFARYPSAVMLGREFMWVVNLVSCALLYVLARRLRLRRLAAAGAVVLFALSPLAIYFHRMVFLDNPATMWMLASLVLAASPRRSLGAATSSGICFAVAVLTKETIVLCLPALLWLLLQHAGRTTRWWSFSAFSAAFTVITLGYPLFAALRGELMPGPGHVSLLGSLGWQLFHRQGSGSLLDPRSHAYGLVRSWVGLGPWLSAAALVLTPVGFAFRRLRPVAAGFGIQALALLRGGYVPYMYVTAMLPFAALVITGVADGLWNRLPGARRGRHCAASMPRALCGRAGRVPVLAALIIFAVVVTPSWWARLEWQSRIHGAAASLAATAWIDHNIPKGSVVVVDDYMWTDITMHGQAYPVWCWKVNADPWVRRHVLPDGYQSIGYIVLSSRDSCVLDDSVIPSLKFALAHSRVVKRLGDGITVRKVETK